MKVFITDLDGTLLNNNSQLSNQQVDTINELIKSHHFTIATGRSLISVRSILKDIQFKLPVITNNGAIIANINDSKPLLINTLSKTETLAALDRLKNLNLEYFVQTFCHVTHNYKVYIQAVTTPGSQWYLEQRKKYQDRHIIMEPYSIKESETPLQIVIVDKTQKLQNLLGPLKNQGPQLSYFLLDNPWLPENSWLDISGTNANKGYACEWLCQKIGLTKNDLYVFGDGANDESMFQSAHKSYAISPHYNELEKYCEQVLPHNDGRSVLNKIQQLI